MSRELFKRCKDFIELVDIPPPPGFVSLYTDIEVELAKPEPEPVAWLSDRGTIWHDKQDAVDDSDGFVEPLYTTPPDQSARIAELTQHLKDAHAENAEFCQIIERQTKQLAALQARDPVLLNEDEINEMVCDYSQINIWEFARAIEQAVLKANGFKVEV